MKLCKCRLHNLENESEETAMERRKLTKEDIDKVRNIEGFPIGTDEDIIALSDAPFYTACPNPFIEDFIKEYGIPYDEATDDYHREPFAADVSEGKTDPIYMAHTYHTKVPHKAIMQYILHYTKPGDLVLDGFCGTGMTGVAAQMCGCPDNDFRYKIEQLNPSVSWGARKAILNDLSPSATFIASNYNAAVDGYDFSEEAHRIVDAAERELGWMYSTHPIQENLLGEKAVINYTLWSDVFYCPHCGKEIVFWNIAIDSDGNMKKELRCDSCGSIIKKSQCARAKDILIDKKSGKTIEISKQVPVLINYSYGGKRYDKVPDALFNILSKAPSWIMDNRKGQQFYIENPSYKGENFADKWNTHPERATAFFKWLDTARKDLVDGRLLQYNKIEMGNHLKECFGSETGKAVFNSEAETVRSAIAAGTLKVDTSTGNISKNGTVSVPPAHHFGA